MSSLWAICEHSLQNIFKKKKKKLPPIVFQFVLFSKEAGLLSSQEVQAAMGKSSVLIRHNNAVFKKRKKEITHLSRTPTRSLGNETF